MILILISFIIIYIIYIILNTLHILYFTQKLNIDNVYNLADTGDLIFFRWKEVSPYHEILSSFTHIGVVIVDNGEKYIVETHLEGDTSNIGVFSGGIHIYPLILRLKNYDGHLFLSKLNINDKPNINTKLFLKNIEQYKKTIPFHNDYRNYFKKNCIKNRLCKNCFSIEEKVGMFCSEFIAFCLKELDIVDKDFEHRCIIPVDFRYIKNKNGENLYKNLIKIL